MNLFLSKLVLRLIASILGLIIFIGLFTNYLKNKYDPFYIKLLNKTDRGLILGDSRALQGMNPECLTLPTFNFAFTIGHSPFDDSYLKLIHKKVDTISKVKRHHIICVTPWSLIYPEKTDQDINPYFSEKLNLPFTNPNWEYILKFWDLSFVNSLKLLRSKSYTTNFGWNNQNIDSNELYREYPRRVIEKIQNYKSKYKKQNLTIESHRVKNLINIISFLKKTGSISIVRLPVSKEMLELENQMFPKFKVLCNKISTDNNIHFVDLTDFHIQTTDGNHIWGPEVSKVMRELNLRIYKNN
jgi:hypothetical protein